MLESEHSFHPGIDYHRKWYVMIAIAIGIFMSTIDSSIVNVALPTLVIDLDTDLPTIQWIVLAYLLTLSTFLLSVGRLADMKGKKSIYTSGFLIFTLGSLFCGISSNVNWLIASRVLQAIGATMILGLGTAIVTEAFPPRELGLALGVTGTMVSIGIVIGPTLGGLLLSIANWHWIFFVNLPLGILGIYLAVRFIPATKPHGGQRFDYPGAFALLLSLLLFLFSLTFGQQEGFNSPRILIMLILSALSLCAFVLIEQRSSQPMIDLKLFRDRLLSINLITGFITFFAIAGTTFLMPFYLENAMGFDERQVGLLLATVPIAMGIVAPISGTLSDRLGSRRIAVIGLLILLVGYYLTSNLNMQTNALEYVLRFLPIGLGMGIFQSPNNSAIMGAAPKERLGVVSGILAINRTIGQITGIAILGAIWSSQVTKYTAEGLRIDATNAPSPLQVAGLQSTLMVTVLLISLALGLSIWALIQEHHDRSTITVKSKVTRD